MRRPKDSDALITAPDSNRTDDVASVIAFAEYVLGTSEKAERWMHKPNRAMGGAVPVELLDTQLGETRVRQILTRIEWGAYS